MPFNGGGFSGGFGLGQAPAVSLSTTAGGSTAQAAGVKEYGGGIWASYQCSSCDTAIRDMQAQLIRVAQALGIGVSTTVDGKVGAGTVAAVQATGRALAARGLPQSMVILAFPTAETVAKNAPQIRDLLRQAGDALHATGGPSLSTVAPSAASPGITTSTTPTMTITPPPGLGPYTATATAPSAIKSKLPYIIAGGIILAGIVTVGVILRTPPKGTS